VAGRKQSPWGSLVVIICGALIATQLGCSNKYSTPESTPAAAFEAAKSAAANKNYREFCMAFTPESQDTMAAFAALPAITIKATAKKAAGLARLGGPLAAKKIEEQFAELDAVLAKHGFTDEKLAELTKTAVTSPQDVRAAIRSVIKDKPGFTADCMAATERISGVSPLANFVGELQDVKIDGDTATGLIVIEDRSEPITFKKTRAGWLLSLPDLIGNGMLPSG